MKIGFCGTVSVGKTTLVNELAKLDKFKNYTIVTERSKYLRDLGIPLNNDSTLKGQFVFLAERASELFQENLITDRTIIDILAFTNNSPLITYKLGDKFTDLASELIREYDVIFYVDPEGVDIEDNGVRHVDPKFRQDIDDQVRKLISKYNKYTNIHHIKGTTEERLKQVEACLDLL